jgi:putative ABC transport system permease protein
MNFQLRLALSYLKGRKLRTFLTTLAVVFGVLVIFGMNIMLPTLLQSLQANLLAGSNSVDLTVSQRSGEPFDTSVLDPVRGVDGVRAAQGILSRVVNLPADYFDHNAQTPDSISSLSLVGIDPTIAVQIRNYTVQAGRFLQPQDQNICVIAQSLADNLKLTTGSLLQLPTTRGQVELTVVGILPPRTIPGNEEILITLPEAQQLLDASRKVNIIEADYTTADGTRRAEIQQTIERRLGDAFQFGALSSNSDLFASIRLGQTLLNVFGALALFMGGFIIFNTFRTLVAERRRDIGMLRAVGASRSTIVGIVLAEGLIQGIIGTLGGMALGLIFGVGLLSAISPMLNSFIHIQVGSPVISPWLIGITVLVGVGVTLLAGLLPALSAGRVTPLEALRPPVAGVNLQRVIGAGAIAGIVLIALAAGALFSGNAGLISLGAVLFLVGLVFIAPALIRPIAVLFGALFSRIMGSDGTGQLAEGNLTRQPSRAAVTASTSMLAIAILVTAGGLVTTVNTTFVDILRKSLGSDYLFVPPAIAIWGSDVGADSSLAQQLKAVDGVGPVSTFRFAVAHADLKPMASVKGGPTTTQGMSVSLLGIDPTAFPQVSAMRFDQGNPDAAYPDLNSGRTMIINGIFASGSGLKPGDSVPLITPNGVLNYKVIAVASDFLNIKVITAYISQANLAADFGKTEDVFIQLNLLKGADRAKVEGQLKSIKQAYPQFTMISGQAYLDQNIQMLKAAFAGLYVLFIFLTIPSLIAMVNTLAIGVIERTREIGMLRAVGSTRKQVSRMVLVEALLLSTIGTVFGLLAGIYLSYVMIYAFRGAGFPVEFTFPWNGVVYATLVGLLSGALASIVPARQAAKLEIVEALHYE